MPTTDDMPIPLVDPADSPRPVADPPNPAFAAVPERATRILRGDIRPQDYLPVTWLVQYRFEGEMDCYRFLAGLAGNPEVAPDTERERLAQTLLHVHCLNQQVAYIQDEHGVAVLASGWEQIGEILRHVPYDLWTGRMRMDFPSDSVWH